MSELGINVVNKEKVATLTFFATFNPESNIYYLQKTINYDSEEKKVAKSRIRIRDLSSSGCVTLATRPQRLSAEVIQLRYLCLRHIRHI